MSEPTKDRRKSKCALCGERVDLREEHYRMVTQFRAHRTAVHVECYRKLKRERNLSIGMRQSVIEFSE